MDEPAIPKSPTRLRDRLVGLREARRSRQSIRRSVPRRRQALGVAARQAVLRKTDGRCHICGGTVVSRWQADHVLAHAGGGRHSAENYLAAHALCNNYRWDYDPEEFQWVLKIGVWARLRMEKGGQLGDLMLSAFAGHEKRRKSRRRSLSRRPAV